MTARPTRMRLISRPKAGGLRHYGVEVTYDDDKSEIFELQKYKGIRVLAMDGFLCGRARSKLRTHEELALAEAVERAWRRLQSKLTELEKKSYHLLFENCEHFARFVVTGRTSSRQVIRATASVVAVVGIVAAAGVIDALTSNRDKVHRA